MILLMQILWTVIVISLYTFWAVMVYIIIRDYKRGDI